MHFAALEKWNTFIESAHQQLSAFFSKQTFGLRIQTERDLLNNTPFQTLPSLHNRTEEPTNPHTDSKPHTTHTNIHGMTSFSAGCCNGFPKQSLKVGAMNSFKCVYACVSACVWKVRVDWGGGQRVRLCAEVWRLGFYKELKKGEIAGRVNWSTHGEWRNERAPSISLPLCPISLKLSDQMIPHLPAHS